MNPSLKAIVERCAAMPIDEKNISCDIGIEIENERLMPIIRELCEVIEEQRKALEFMTMPLTGTNPSIDSLIETIATDIERGKEILTATTKRLEQLGLGEGK